MATGEKESETTTTGCPMTTGDGVFDRETVALADAERVAPIVMTVPVLVALARPLVVALALGAALVLAARLAPADVLATALACDETLAPALGVRCDADALPLRAADADATALAEGVFEAAADADAHALDTSDTERPALSLIVCDAELDVDAEGLGLDADAAAEPEALLQLLAELETCAERERDTLPDGVLEGAGVPLSPGDVDKLRLGAAVGDARRLDAVGVAASDGLTTADLDTATDADSEVDGDALRVALVHALTDREPLTLLLTLDDAVPLEDSRALPLTFDAEAVSEPPTGELDVDRVAATERVQTAEADTVIVIVPEPEAAREGERSGVALVLPHVETDSESEPVLDSVGLRVTRIDEVAIMLPEALPASDADALAPVELALVRPLADCETVSDGQFDDEAVSRGVDEPLFVAVAMALSVEQGDALVDEEVAAEGDEFRDALCAPLLVALAARVAVALPPLPDALPLKDDVFDAIALVDAPPEGEVDTDEDVVTVADLLADAQPEKLAEVVPHRVATGEVDKCDESELVGVVL